jgi:ATP-dependent metalloprotease
MVSYLPEADKYDMTREECFAHIDTAMGGKAAEELIFGIDKTTTGVTSDLRSATRYARHMVAECGMSEELGPIYAESGGSHDDRKVSGDLERRIDAEVLRIVREAYQRAVSILKAQEADLHRLAGALLDYETLSTAEIRQVLDGTFSRPLPTARAIEAAGYDLDAVELPAAAITPQNAAAAPEEAAAAAGAA